jgi:carbamoyltransferase
MGRERWDAEVAVATVLGVNAVFHDPAAALVVDGRIVAAAEEERFSRRKHGKVPVAFSTWELPEQSARWCLDAAGLTPADVDAVAYSYDPALAAPRSADVVDENWEHLRTLYVERAPRFLSTALPGLGTDAVRFVPHHVAHAASAYLGAPWSSSAVMVIDGRGERASYLAGVAVDGRLDVLRRVELPHSLGLVYEGVTEHLGFRRSSDEYKVMALASYGTPRHLDALRRLVTLDGEGGFRTEPIRWDEYVPARVDGEHWDQAGADLAASVQRLLEEIELDLARWLHDQTGERVLTFAGGVALNCVANTRVWAEGPFDDVWVQPAAGDAGTALGAALHIAHELGDPVQPMTTAALGRAFDDAEIAAVLATAAVSHDRSRSVPAAVAQVLADDGVVGWFDGRSEWGPRALGHRSLLANPCRAENLERLNDIKGREQFRPVAPMVLAERAHEIFEGGPIPSPYMLFTHRVRPEWRDRIPAVVHVDGTARIQTVDRREEPRMAAVLDEFAARTGVPVVVNTSFNTAGRPMVDSPRDALECFGSSPIDLLAMGDCLARRATAATRVA